MAVLRIEQAEGNEGRVVEFADAALPLLDGFKWGAVRQRSQVTRPPHARAAEVHLLGEELEDAEFSFKWRGRDIIGNGAVRIGEVLASPASVDVLCQYLEDFAASSALVVVTFGTRQRFGILAAFDASPTRAHEVRASITVTWVARERESQRANAAQPDARKVYDTVAVDWTERLHGLAEPATGLQGAVNAIETAVADCSAAITSLGAAAYSASGIASVTGPLEAMRTSAVAAELAASVCTGVLAATDDPLIRLLAGSYRAKVARAARRVKERAAVERYGFVDAERADILGVHEAMEGDTVWTVARAWYGTPEGAADLRRANGLTGPRLRPGQRLIVPVRHAA